MQIRMKYVERQTAKGRKYYYYRRNAARWGRLHGEPGSTQWLADYHRIHATFKGNHNTAIPDSFDDVVTRYLSSPEYAALADNTRSIYRLYLDHARGVLGRFDIESIKRKHIRAYRDSMQDKPGKATLTIRIISALYDWAGEAMDVESNPAKGVKLIKGGDGYQAWPEAAIERFLEAASPELAAVFLVGLYTGQRKGDVIALRWDAIEAGGLNFKQQKTKTVLWVPIHPTLARVIESLPKRGTVMLTTTTGRAWTSSSLESAFKRCRKKAGCDGLQFHGLRKTAASKLAEVGCTTEEIKSITGHKSDQMAAYYAKGAEQKRKATNAMNKLAGEQNQSNLYKLPNFKT
jgi:integrase